MVFIPNVLKYLDDALTTVTGRYEEDDDDVQSDEAQSIDDVGDEEVAPTEPSKPSIQREPEQQQHPPQPAPSVSSFTRAPIPSHTVSASGDAQRSDGGSLLFGKGAMESALKETLDRKRQDHLMLRQGQDDFDATTAADVHPAETKEDGRHGKGGRSTALPAAVNQRKESEVTHDKVEEERRTERRRRLLVEAEAERTQREKEQTDNRLRSLALEQAELRRQQQQMLQEQQQRELRERLEDERLKREAEARDEQEEKDREVQERERLRSLEDEQKEREEEEREEKEREERERERQRLFARERELREGEKRRFIAQAAVEEEETRALAKAAEAAAKVAADNVEGEKAKWELEEQKEEQEAERMQTRLREGAEDAGRDTQHRLALERGHGSEAHQTLDEGAGLMPFPSKVIAENEHESQNLVLSFQSPEREGQEEQLPRHINGSRHSDTESVKSFRNDADGTGSTSPATAAVPMQTDRQRAREEAWAAARMLAEDKARANAMRAAAFRKGTERIRPSSDEDKTSAYGAVEGNNGVVQGRNSVDLIDYDGRIAKSAASPTSSEMRESLGAKRYRGREQVTSPGDRRSIGTRVDSTPTRGAPLAESAGERVGHASPTDAQGFRRVSVASSVTSSQVSTLIDPGRATPLGIDGNPTSVRRPAGHHDFQKMKTRRKSRGNEYSDRKTAGTGASITALEPPPECAACLGLWDSGGSALNRWYRCRSCGGTVHGACRQFFETGEACVEGSSGDGSNKQVGWRTAVNRAGVVQVGVLQAFTLPVKSGESVYVSLRLLPWKERVKTGSAKWEEFGATWSSHPSARHDLLHLYNSNTTPVPTLRVEVWRSAMRVLDDLLGYVCIDMAPLLARPGSTSERWHVLSSPSDDISGNNAVAGGNTEAAAQSGTATKSSAGTILLSLGFTPTGGTPRIRPLSAVGPASTSRNSRSTTPGGFISGIVSVSPSANGGGGSGWGDSGRRTPRTSLTPAIPEGFSLTDEIATTASALLSSTPSENRAAGGEEPRPRQGMVDSRTRAKPGGVNGDKLFDRAGTGNTQSKSFFGGIGGQEEGISSSLDSKRVEATGEGGRGLELGDGDGDTQQAEGKVHLFRVRNYSAPVWCEVCQRLLMGVFTQGFSCEACGMNVHRGCQLRANFSQSCPGQANKEREGRRHGIGHASSLGYNSDRSNSKELDEGVGLLQINLRAAHRCGSRCHGENHSYLSSEQGDKGDSGSYMGSGTHSAAVAAAKTPGGTPTQLRDGTALQGFPGSSGDSSSDRRRRGRPQDGGDFSGDHYCRVSLARKGSPDEAEEVRTEAVFQTPDPVFDRTWVFVAPSYDSTVTIDLVDASTDRPAGRFETTIIALLQGDYDARAVGQTPPSQEEGDRRLLSPGDASVIAGLLKVRLEFDEHTDAFFGPNGILGPGGGATVRLAPPRQKADLSVESIKALVARVKGIIRWLQVANYNYSLLMSWENPALSSISLVAFVYLTLVANAEYLLALLPFFLLMFMTWGLISRRTGRYVEKWIQSERLGLAAGSKALEAGFRPVATLKVAVVKGRGLVSPDLSLPGNAYVRVTYVPDGNANAVMETSIDNTSATSSIGGDSNSQLVWKEFLVGQTFPHPVDDSPDWGRMGGAGLGGGVGSVGGVGGLAGAGFAGDQHRGPGDLWSGGDALLQNTVDFWAREALSAPSTSGGDNPADRVPDGSKKPYTVKEDMCFVYPVLQPDVRDTGKKGMLPWTSAGSKGCLRFAVLFANPFNSLMDSPQGHVIVPLSALASAEAKGGPQPEVRGWFEVSPPREDLPRSAASSPSRGSAASFMSTVSGAQNIRLGPDPRRTSAKNVSKILAEDSNNGGTVISSHGPRRGGALYLRIQLSLRDIGAPLALEEVEASRALQTVLGVPPNGEDDTVQGSDGGSGAAAGGAGKTGKTGREGVQDRGGGSGGGVAKAAGKGTVARWLGLPAGVWGTVKDVQDAVGDVLDALETAKNLINWTHPPKTFLVYMLVALVWLVLLIVPGRYIVLALGLYEFSKVWIGVQPQGNDDAPTPIAMKLRNLLVSLPVDSELAACYSWEARQYAAREDASARLREQRAKLRLLGAGRQWEGALRVRDRAGDPWESRYVVVLGHRLAWWGSSKELDEGRKARGQLLLQGHAGVTGLSPMEMREIQDPRRVVCVFGRSPDGLPHKVSFMGGSIADKEALEHAVTSVVETKHD